MEWYLIFMPNTKIVATLGPASDSPDAIRQLLLAGVDVFRLNASHSTQAEHAARITAIRQVTAESGSPAAILLDLQGPKIRLGSFAGGSATLVAGGVFTITPEPILGNSERASTTYPKPRRRRQTGRPHPAGRWRDRTARARCDRHGRAHRGSLRRRNRRP